MGRHRYLHPLDDRHVETAREEHRVLHLHAGDGRGVRLERPHYAAVFQRAHADHTVRVTAKDRVVGLDQRPRHLTRAILK